MLCLHLLPREIASRSWRRCFRRVRLQYAAVVALGLGRVLVTARDGKTIYYRLGDEPAPKIGVVLRDASLPKPSGDGLRTTAFSTASR